MGCSRYYQQVRRNLFINFAWNMPPKEAETLAIHTRLATNNERVQRFWVERCYQNWLEGNQ